MRELAELARLARLIEGDVDQSNRRLIEYSSDASNYRVVPAGVVFPRSAEDLAATVSFARAAGLTITGRGGGTSVAGNAIGPGLVLDFSRYLNRIIELDPETRTAIVQPGVIAADLQRRAAEFGLRFGPDPSTQSRCTVGGMIGNNACGPRAVAYGRTSESVLGLSLIDGCGELRSLSTGFDQIPELAAVRDHHLATIRTTLGTFSRQASGYALEHLLPERGQHIARALVGSEGTCGLVTEATVRLVEAAPHVITVVLGFADLPMAAQAAGNCLLPGVLAIEGIDGRIAQVLAAHGRPVPVLPRGAAVLCLEVGGETLSAATELARQITTTTPCIDFQIHSDPQAAAQVWRMRADGAGLAGRTPAGEPAWPGWEDAAVPQPALAPYLRDFRSLTTAFGVDGLIYGHFGDGCVHTRLDFPIGTDVVRYGEFLTEAAQLVVRHGGSLSGEHGDGRARSELLELMYPAETLAAFRDFKRCFDPDNVLNPGVLVDPAPVLDSLRLVRAIPSTFSSQVHQCTGVGQCRSTAGGFMCPSYRATLDEKDSTRARARVLQELTRTDSRLTGWKAPEIAESLELCLSCKACRTDCPTGIDMAAYKSEYLFQRYRRRLRPRTHYSLGRLPAWLRLGRRLPRLANRLSRNRVLLRFAGIDPRRALPRLDPVATQADPTKASADVLLWLDSFTRSFGAETVAAAQTLLAEAGVRVTIGGDFGCCGLTWTTTGQLTQARRAMATTIDALWPIAQSGQLIVGLEPSCLAALRTDMPDQFPDDARVATIVKATRTLAELLVDTDWQPPDLTDTRVILQPHCHQYASSGSIAEQTLLRRAGASVDVIEGCCGMAGNFGMERDHYDISRTIAEQGVIGKLRQAPGAVLIADGLSCRSQVSDLTRATGTAPVEALNLATFFATRGQSTP